MINTKWLNNVITFTIGWVISLFLWRLIRIDGFKGVFKFLRSDYSIIRFIFFVLILSIILGTIFGSIQFYNEHYKNKRKSFIILLIQAILSHLLVMLILYFSIFIVLRYSKINTSFLFFDYIKDPLIIANLIYSLITNFLIVIVLYLNKLLGKNNLYKLITGSFHKPQEEYRIFMFIDLEGSTEIAEKLGHIKYSQFIQDCFYDLSVFETSNADVYQYVGDEAVLTWKVKTNKKLMNKINGYFLFKERLLSKHEYYTSNYDVTPLFKASMHLGPVTAVEVGSLKREIAYHGDTLNICSRIQKQCKIFNQDFLVSGSIVNAMENNLIFTFTKIEKLILKGKKEPTTIYSVKKNE